MGFLFWVFFILLVLLALLKVYVIASCGRFKIREQLPGKVVLITGCTSGIGREIAYEFAKAGAKVYMACRNQVLAEQVAEHIRAQTGSTRVFILQCDLSRLRSVRECAEAFIATGDPLHILINNAGLAREARKRVSEDGLEETMASNYFGHFLLTVLLLDKLKASAPARIVVLSSIMHRFARLDTSDLNYDRRSFPGAAQAYNDSKLANILFSNELAVRLKNSGVTCNAVHPGVVKTDIYRRVPFYLQPFLRCLYIFFKTPKEGAESVLFNALSPALDHVTGHYFWDNKPAATSLRAADYALAAELWAVSEKITGLVD